MTAPDGSAVRVDLAREQAFRLGALQISPPTREVIDGADRQVLQPRVMQVLVALARRRGEVLSRSDLTQACWAGRVVGEDAIERCIAAVRRLASARGGFALETVPRVGYRLTAAEDVGPDMRVPAVRAAEDAAETVDEELGAGGGRPSVAVLAFEHPADDREQAYLAVGIAEDMITALSRFKWLHVLSRHSSLHYDKSPADFSRIKKDLGVRYILSGRLVCKDRQLRLTASLTDCAMGDTVWSRRFDGSVSDIFAIQDEVTALMVGALEPALMRREEAAAKQPAPRNLKHWDLFIRGRWHFWQLTYGHVAKARAFLEQALALQPDDAHTVALLAHTQFTRVWSAWSEDPDADLQEARRLAMRAVRLDADDAFAHHTFGIALSLTGELDRAMAEQRRALELNPNFAGAVAEIGRYLAFSGDYDQAISHLDRAIRASPGDSHYFLWFRDKSIAAFTVERYEDAIAFANQAVTLRPDVFFNHYLLAANLAAAGVLDRARRVFAEGRQLLPAYPLKNLKHGHPFARADDLDRFVGALRQCGWAG